MKKIGLLRHFKVKTESPRHCNSREYDLACERYNRGDVEPGAHGVPTADYSICYASSMKRAILTAQHVFDKEIVPADELVEIPIQAIFKTDIRLPFLLWHVINRTAWMMNLERSPETRDQTRERAARFLSGLEKSDHENILVVSHGFFILTLQEELYKRGFKGPRITHPKHGRLYEFCANVLPGVD